MITESWLKAQSGKVRPSQTIKADRDGLGARVSPKGKITWQLRYYHNSKQGRVDIGTYPLIGLKAVRDEATRLRAELEKGRDPRLVKKLEINAAANPETLGDGFAQWYESYCMANKKGHTEILRSFELYVLPRFGGLPMSDIRTDMWLTLLEEISKNSESISARILVNSKQLYKWATRRRLIDANPLEHINAAQDLNIRKRKSTRVLDDDEIRMFFLGLTRSRMAPKNKLFLQLCLFFGCRNGELRLAEKSHFDLDAMTWTVPPENHKTGKSTQENLVRPIIPEVLPLLEETMALSGSNKHLFTNAGTDDPMGQGAPVAMPYNVMQWLRRHQGYEMAHWSVHDLRRTVRTNLSTLAAPHVCEIILGHKMPGEWGTYDRHTYLPEQAEAYQKWWERLQGFMP